MQAHADVKLQFTLVTVIKQTKAKTQLWWK